MSQGEREGPPGGQSQNLWGDVESQWQGGEFWEDGMVCAESQGSKEAWIFLEWKEDSRGHGGRGRWFGVAVSRWHGDHDGDFGFTLNETPLAAALRVEGLGQVCRGRPHIRRYFAGRYCCLSGGTLPIKWVGRLQRMVLSNASLQTSALRLAPLWGMWWRALKNQRRVGKNDLTSPWPWLHGA